jgi:hypothetical protein
MKLFKNRFTLVINIFLHFSATLTHLNRTASTNRLRTTVLECVENTYIPNGLLPLPHEIKTVSLPLNWLGYVCNLTQVDD